MCGRNAYTRLLDNIFLSDRLYRRLPWMGKVAWNGAYYSLRQPKIIKYLEH